jgi:hypothetical protein
MHVKLASKLLASSVAALLLVAVAAPTIAAPDGAGAAQQTGKPDCKKDPSDPRCAKD